MLSRLPLPRTHAPPRLSSQEVPAGPCPTSVTLSYTLTYLWFSSLAFDAVTLFHLHTPSFIIGASGFDTNVASL